MIELSSQGFSEIAPLAQLDRASVFGTEGWGFESLRAQFFQFILKIKRALVP